MISSARMSTVNRPRKKSAAFTTRQPRGLLRWISASSASSTAGMSADGSACATLPPIVPRLRTCGSPMLAAASATAGHRACSRADVATSWCTVAAPMTIRAVALVDAVQVRNAADVDQHLRLAQAQLHQRHEAVAAGDELAALAGRRQLRQRIVERGGARVFECRRDHAWPPWMMRHSFSGRSIMSMCVTPNSAQRVDRRVDDARRRAERAGLAHALGAEWVHRRRRHRRVELEAREVGGARQRVVHERAGQQLPVLVVDGLLDHRLADALRQPAVDLPFDDERVDQIPGVVDGHEFQQRRLAGLAVDLRASR